MKNTIISFISIIGSFIILGLLSIPFLLFFLVTGFSLILSWVLFRKFPNFNI